MDSKMCPEDCVCDNVIVTPAVGRGGGLPEQTNQT